MTPCQKIKREILLLAKPHLDWEVGPLDTARDVENEYSKLIDADLDREYEEEFRHGQVKTGLPSEYSRHYEAEEVAAQMSDGSWLGWTRWFGGGKHGEPGSIDWMSDAYELEVTEEEKLVVVRTFKKKGDQGDS